MPLSISSISNMEVFPLVHCLLLLAFFIFSFTTSTTSFSDYFDSFSDFDDSFSNFGYSDEPRATSMCKFERTEEVYRECSPVLSLESKVKLKNKNIYANDISFQNGDWVQEAGGAPLMPFDDSDMPKNFSGTRQSLLKLVSFWLMGADFAHETENTVSFCGLLYIGITRNRTLPYMPDRWTPRFHSSPGYSRLNIPFEGLYVESEENGGERLMCLLGKSYSPFSEVFNDPLKGILDYGCKQKKVSPYVEDDRIMLVLRYPQNFTLTSRALNGEMRSLNEKANPKYFDTVKIYSQLGYDSKYLFDSKQLVSKACETYPYQDELIDDGIQVFKGFQYCKVFQLFASEIFDIVMVSKCDGTTKYCNKLGPFMLGKEIDEKNGILDNLRLVMTSLRCVSGDHLNKVRTAKVSAVFRALSPGEDRYTSEARTGLSGMTISAEGTWNSSSGQLCMVGCVGLEADSDGCNTRVCLYLPVTFTITQRSIIIGTISSIKKTDPHSSLLFNKVLHPLDLWNRYSKYSNSHLSYKYSKIELASALLKRSEFSTLETFIKTLFLNYPAVQDRNNLTSLSLLSNELSLDVLAFPGCLFNAQAPKVFVKFEVLSLGHLFGRYMSHMKDSYKGEDTEFHSDSDSPDQKLPLNISGHLTLRSSSYSHISKLFLEGLYDPLGGKMYLIGCRDVQSTQKLMHNDMNLESEMDCLIQVKIVYSSKTTRWLFNPTAKVFIASQRTEEDPLYFSPIRLCTSLIPYRDNSKEIIFRQNFEVFFRILMLVASIACLASQLLYIKNKDDVIPFMSLTMPGVQALGFALPLIADTAILFKWKEYDYPESRSLLQIGKSMQFQLLNSVMKFLSLVAFVLALRLCRKVWESRLLTGKPITLKHNHPGDKRVLFITWIIHLVGFLVLLITHRRKAEHLRTNQKLPEWMTELEVYMGLVQDFFLLPQIIGNVIWQTRVRPLSRVYYIGFTVIKFLLHGYDYLRDPLFSSYFHKSESLASSEFFSKSQEIMIVAVLAVLATTVHTQQRYWNFSKLGSVLKSKACGACNLNNKLLSKSSEARAHCITMDETASQTMVVSG